MANRYRDQFQANEIPMEAQDSGFLGVNTQLDPGLLKTGAAYSDLNQMLAGPGLCSMAINTRFRRGVAETRQGTVAPTWCNPRNPDAALYAPAITSPTSSYAYRDAPGLLYMYPNDTARPMQYMRAIEDIVNIGKFIWYGHMNLVDQYWIEYNSGITGWRLVHYRAGAGGGVQSYTNATVQGEWPWDCTWPDGRIVLESPWVEPWRERILAVAGFADPDGVENLMLVFPSAVYQCREGVTPVRIGLPPGVVLDDPCELIQTFDSMVLLRGFDHPPLAWDGTGDAFEPIPAADPEGSYTASIPPAETGAVMSSRLLLVSGRDTVAVSDILNFTRYDAELNEFRINTGEDDAITAIFPWRRTNCLVFKSHSVHAVVNVTGDLAAISAEIVNSEIGCIAPKSVAAVGGDVFFLSAAGVFRLSEVVEQSMQVQERPVSEPIDSLIKRINWDAVATASAVVQGDYYRLAVPIDGATRPNVVLVYDTVRGYWQGYDEYPAKFNPDVLGRTKHNGRRHAIAVDKARAIVAVLDVGTKDVGRPTALSDSYVWPLVLQEFDITTTIQTRGYILLDDGVKRIRHGSVTLETWNPSYTIATVTDGVEEVETVLGPRTRNRLKWHLHGKTDYVETNASDNHAAPKREDYSVAIPSTGFQCRTGIRLGLMQQSLEQFAIRRQAQWLAIRITNTKGRIAVKSSGVDGQNRRNMARVFT